MDTWSLVGLGASGTLFLAMIPLIWPGKLSKVRITICMCFAGLGFTTIAVCIMAHYTPMALKHTAQHWIITITTHYPLPAFAALGIMATIAIVILWAITKLLLRCLKKSRRNELTTRL